jgi:hypothetical protein
MKKSLSSLHDFVFLASLALAHGAGAATVVDADGHTWQTYTCYRPQIDRVAAVDAATQPLRYNHDSSVAWFRDRWVCLWNANTIPEEGAPGQLNYAATSRDGLTWSAPLPVFAQAAHSHNPVPCPTGTQWQPNLLVVSNRLWCLWSQNSRDAYNGCYFSVLDTPDGLWTNRLLTWNTQTDPVLDGRSFRIFPTQNPLRLSTGRVLAPVTLIGPTSSSAPAGKSGWYWQEKRNSVLYTDDDGATWQVSPGTTLPQLDWRQWEPTVYEQADGTVVMLARNNLIPAFEGASAKPDEALTVAYSHDHGASWAPLAFVPLQTVVSRMHAFRPLTGDRAFLLHNDWRSGTWGTDRRNLALFLGRNTSTFFTPGLGFSGDEPEVAYPQGDIHGNTLLVAYSQGPCAQRSIHMARISPLPDPDHCYLLLRDNRPLPPRCICIDNALHLRGTFSLPLAHAPAMSATHVALKAEIHLTEEGVLFDNRGATNGFVWALSGTLFVHLGDPNRNLRSTLPVPRNRECTVAVEIDYPKGEILFRVDDATERVTFKPGNRSLAGNTATLFGPHPKRSALHTFQGAIRTLTLDGTNRLFDASVPHALAAFGGIPQMPEPEGVTQTTDAQDAVLRFRGAASAGVEWPRHTEHTGDARVFTFEVRPEHGETFTLCTFGDARTPARITVNKGLLALETAQGSQPCGTLLPKAWNRLTLIACRDTLRVTRTDHPTVTVQHAPQLPTLFLGEGYPASTSVAPSSFLVRMESIRSRILPQGTTP